MEPMLVRSKLTGRIYITTRYEILGTGQIRAARKFDRTEQFNEIVEEIKKEKETSKNKSTSSDTDEEVDDFKPNLPTYHLYSKKKR